MPFTLAHPLLPVLIRRYATGLSMTALVAGSIVPDLENFLQLYDTDAISHSLMGIFLFDLPAGLVICFVFHLLLRDALLYNLPYFLRKHLFRQHRLYWPAYFSRNWPVILFSLLLGVLTHLGWDAFTHKDGWVVVHASWMQHVVNAGDIHWPVFYIFQLASSIGGMLAFVGWFFYKPGRKTFRPDHCEPDNRYWLLIVLLFVLILVFRLAGWPELNTYLGLWRAVMGAVFYSWILASLIFLLNTKHKKKLQQLAAASGEA